MNVQDLLVLLKAMVNDEVIAETVASGNTLFLRYPNGVTRTIRVE